jgi:broad specificity phosphatase PhoE
MEIQMQNGWLRRVLGAVLTPLIAAVLLVAAVLPANAMTVTFVRHGESQANFDNRIDTSVPGPGLTPTGVTQSAAVAAGLVAGGVDYDAIYTSTMVRTQQTAQPFADATGLTPTALSGLREIGAGIFEGQPEDSGVGRIGYVISPLAWALGLRSVPILGGADGNAFDARVDGALKQIQDSGAEHPVVFSHGATIMFWTLMNVDNPDLGLLLRHPLDNTDVVVVDGNAEDGWTLKSWAGRPVGPATFGTKLFVDVRDLVVAPQTGVYNVVKALRTGDIGKIATAIRDGVATIVTAPVKFAVSVARDIAQEVAKVVRPKTATTSTSTSSAAVTAAAPETGVESAEPAAAKAPKTLTLAKPKKGNGATDLSKGNKVEPGEIGTVHAAPKKDESAAESTDATSAPTAPAATEPADPKPATGSDDTSDKTSDKTGEKAADKTSEKAAA